MQQFMKRTTTAGQIDGLPSWLSELLVARGIDTTQKAKAFLSPSLDALLDPYLLSDMQKAIDIIKQIKKEKKAVVIYGDYDVDGVCASAIMHDALSNLGLQVAVYIPDRHEEGYGLNKQAVALIAQKAGLLVTVDCGITSIDEVNLAKELHMQVIITDHHQPKGTLPNADAVINPLLNAYPFPYLCGAGVAFKVCQALHGIKNALSCIDLAALATVADLVPLLDENRILVHEGLHHIATTKRIGLRALLNVSALPADIKSHHIAFALAPRLNAGGRLESTLIALELLQSTNEDEALQKALKLETLNQKRRALEAQVQEDAEKQIAQMDLCSHKAIVVASADYPSGVVGLSAGRIAQRYGYPTVVLSIQGEMAVGSARSANEIDLFKALTLCADLFTRFGGHKQAAGLTIPVKDIAIFTERFSQAVQSQLEGNVLMPTHYYDVTLPISEVNEENYHRISLLEPCGMGNPAPVFLAQNVQPLYMRAVGAQKTHLKLMLESQAQSRGAIAFGQGHLADTLSGNIDVLYTLTRNEFMHKVSYECTVNALSPIEKCVKTEILLESKVIMQDFYEAPQNTIQFPFWHPITEVEQATKDRPQGVLLYCHCLETAQEMAQKYKGYRLLQSPLTEPFAYNSIAYQVPLSSINAPFHTLVLCDGLTDALPALSPLFIRAQLFTLPCTNAIRQRMHSFTPTIEQLRMIYKTIVTTKQTGIAQIAQLSDQSIPHVIAGLYIFDEMKLIALHRDTLAFTILPMVKCDIAKSNRYQRLMVMKGGT